MRGGIKSSRPFKLVSMTRFIILSFFTSSLMADVISSTGQIKFDIQMDNQAEMTLNSTGLGIGTTPSSNLYVNGNAIITDQVFVGGSSGSSNLNVNGTIGYGFQTVSSNTTLGEYSAVLVDSSSDNITITLPYAGNVSGRQYKIKKISTYNSVWISGGGNLIDDTSLIELPESNDLASVKLISDGNQWYKIEQKDLSETVASENLILWWKLDETSGNTAYDSSSNDNNSLSADPGLLFTGLEGKYLNTIDFDGSSSFSFPDISTHFSDEATLSVWLKLDSNSPSSGDGGIFSITTNGQRSQYPWTNGDLYFNVFRSTRYQTTDNSSFDKTQWHHLVITSSPGNDNYIIYQNGVPFYVDDGEASIVLGDRIIGESDTHYFNGLMDDFRLYNKSLTANQVVAIYNQGQ